MSDDLKQKLSKLPVAPGVYFHKNAAGEIIYIGKAAVLKNRVRQYFQNTKKDPKTRALVKEIADVDWIIVDTEIDALFLESEMIKRYMPKWNILLRDDKTVSYVRINMKDEVPYLSFTRTPVDDGATYVGPFYGKAAIERALRILRRVFPYYNKPYTGKKTLDDDLGLTPGVENNKMSSAEYKSNLRKLIRYLRGDRQKLLKSLEKAMNKAADKGEYEAAAKARDQLFGLRELSRKIIFSDKEFLDISSDQALDELAKLLSLSSPPKRIEGYDISHQSGTNTVGSMVVFLNGVASRDKYRRFKLRTTTNNDIESLREVVARRLKHREWEYPDLIILDGGEFQINAILPLVAALGISLIGRDKSGSHSKSSGVKIVVPGQGIRELPRNSHIARLIARIDEEAHRFAVTYHSLLKRKGMLK